MQKATGPTQDDQNERVELHPPAAPGRARVRAPITKTSLVLQNILQNIY